jgi:hypothetical protein
MENFELVQAAAAVIRKYGWTSGIDTSGQAINARDESGNPVPLFIPNTDGNGRATLNRRARTFSIYGALVAAAAAVGEAPSLKVWDTLRDMAAAATDVAHGGTNHVHPIFQYNEMEGRTKEDVLTFMELVATALGAPPPRLSPYLNSPPEPNQPSPRVWLDPVLPPGVEITGQMPPVVALVPRSIPRIQTSPGLAGTERDASEALKHPNLPPPEWP